MLKPWINSLVSTIPSFSLSLDSCLLYLATPSEEIVLAAEELRQAANALGRITGRVDVEDVLDALFSQFCIGK